MSAALSGPACPGLVLLETMLRAILLLMLLSTGLALPAAAQPLAAEAQRGLAFALDLQRQQDGAENCPQLAQALGGARFGPQGQGRWLLVKSLANLESLSQSGLLTAVVEMPPGCGWTHLVATLPKKLVAEPASTRLSPGLARPELDDDLGGYWSRLQGLWGVALLMLLAAPLLLWLRLRRVGAPTEAVPAIALPPAPAPDARLDRLLQERSALLAEMKAAGLEVADELQRLQQGRQAEATA